MSRDSRDDREDSGSEDDSKGTIRVGRDFQVITPSWVPPERKKLVFTNRIHIHDHSIMYICTYITKSYLFTFLERRPEQCPERALLVWSPNPAISQAKRKLTLSW